MALIEDPNFIKIEIDNKVVNGNSPEESHKNWFEGYFMDSFQLYSSVDGVSVPSFDVRLLVVNGLDQILSTQLNQGKKDLKITVVKRCFHDAGSNYEAQNIVFDGCVINGSSIEFKEEKAFLSINFRPEKSIQATWQLVDASGTEPKLVKVGPLGYNFKLKSKL
jgi:hypothetical protein